MSSQPAHSAALRPAPAGRREAGLVLAYVAILGLVLIGLAGLALDTALVKSTVQQLQYAADAAALAAVRHVEVNAALTEPDYTTTRAAAIGIAAENEAGGSAVQLEDNPDNADGGDIVVGYWDGESFAPNTDNPNAVRVKARRTASSQGGPLDLVFGPLFGATTAEVEASAIAVLGGMARPVVLVLDPSGAGALQLSGAPALSGPTGRIHVNSTDPCALQLVGSARIDADLVTTTGGICAAQGLIDGEIGEGEAVVPDPLVDVLPDSAAWEGLKAGLALPLGEHGAITTSGTFAPGYYPGGISLAGQSSVTLQSGLYLLGGAGLSLREMALLAGTRVVLLIDAGSTVIVRGSASLRLSAPGPGEFRGVGLFSHRANTGLAVTLGGTGDVSIDGTVYVPSGTFRMAGNPTQVVSALIAFRLENVGDAMLHVDGPPDAAIVPVAYLVQ